MSSQRSNVYIHQGSSGSSTANYSSRSSSSSAPSTTSRSGSVRREYDSQGRAAEVVRSGNSVVINHRKRDYEVDSPTPYYRGTY
ncbi:hypothetical protein V8C35DRAFT_275046 [Trichoderma chlorosporum]